MTYKNILKESLTVNENVKQIASEIKNEILMRLKKQSIAMAKETNDLIKQGIFTYFTNGKLSIKSFKVKYYVTLYPSIDKYNDALYKNALNLNSECDYEKAVMTLRLAMINCELTRESYGIIEHETNHFLQNSLGQTKNETLYNKIVQQCKNGSKITKRLAYALYLSLNTEISSFAVQYYSFLKNNKIPLENVYDEFPNDEGNPYNEFYSYKNYADFIKDEFGDKFIKSLFGISKKEYYDRLENADKRYKNKMMKAATKYRDELHEHLIYRVNKNTNLSNTIMAKRMNFEVKCHSYGITDEISLFD